jgi:hypothetical protein
MVAANMTGRCAGFLVLLVTAVRLVAAPPEPIQKPVKLLGLGADVDQEFAKLTDMGITPSLTYYGVFQGNPVGGIQQRTAYSQLILFGVESNFEKLIGLPGGSLTISGAQAMGENLSSYIGNINTVSEAFATPSTVLFYELYWKQLLFGDKLELRFGRMTPADQSQRYLHSNRRSAGASTAIPPAFSSMLPFAVRRMQVGPLPPKSKPLTSSMSKAAFTKPANAWIFPAIMASISQFVGTMENSLWVKSVGRRGSAHAPKQLFLMEAGINRPPWRDFQEPTYWAATIRILTFPN